MKVQKIELQYQFFQIHQIEQLEFVVFCFLGSGFYNEIFLEMCNQILDENNYFRRYYDNFAKKIIKKENNSFQHDSM